MFVPLATSGCSVPADKFWNALFIYFNRPHIINKKIVGVVRAYFYKVQICSNELTDINDLFTYSAMIYEMRKLPELTKAHLADFIRNILEPHRKNLVLMETDTDSFVTQNSGLFVSLRILLPKQRSCKKCIEVVVLNKDRCSATFHSAVDENGSILAPAFPYTLELTMNGQFRIVIKHFEDAESSSAEWLVDKLFFKLLKWFDTEGSCIVNKESLSLIILEKYTDLYQGMKVKYGQKIVDIWPENTDPLKFVYEDIAIAAYLLCLWEEIFPNRKPSFIDLGCGNGLLVNILNQEGYRGIGVDLRKRKIWDMYPENVTLEVRTLVPSSSSLFPDADWIIGNHSDELTPWIPVIAARSSFKTNFFVLPCCSYDFNGQKYKRVCTSKSQYGEYLEYITEIGRKCGFITNMDKLRIPSTKKTCIVSVGRNYAPEDYEKIDMELTKFIEACGSNELLGNSLNWINNFNARSQEERVKNCTRLDKILVSRIVKCVSTKLLEQKNFLEGQYDQMWNAGGTVAISDLISCLNGTDLKQLKCECGGLQTLLRNHRYIFQVVKGTVKIRVPIKYTDNSRYKSKPCWFFINHPDGCLHDEAHCAYSHK